MQVLIDGVVEDEFLTNESRVGAYSFSSSIEVRVYNSGVALAGQTSSSYNLRGKIRPPAV